MERKNDGSQQHQKGKRTGQDLNLQLLVLLSFLKRIQQLLVKTDMIPRRARRVLYLELPIQFRK
jgi:hypothetical protein